MPTMRQTVMFSATMPQEIRKLAERFMMNPKEVTVDKPSSTATTVEQSLIRVDGRAKRRVLSQILRTEEIENGLIFCNRKRDVATLYKALEQEGISVGALHGDMDQYKRMEWLDKFRKGEIKILVCSDVAARGLDIPTVGHVINYDVPIHPEDYVHRIGRTGRAGRSGKAFTIATPMEEKPLRSIERLIGKPIQASSLFEKLEGFVPEEGAPEEAAEAKPARRSTRPPRGSARPPREAKPAPQQDKPAEAQDKPVQVQDKPAQQHAKPADRPARSRGASKDRPADKRPTRENADAVEATDGMRFGDTDLVPAFLRRAAM